jgi:serine/threonine protein kinase
MDKPSHLTRCRRCGTPLQADTPVGFCPACFSALAEGSTVDFQSGSRTTGQAIEGWHDVVPLSIRPVPGRAFGPYHIERLLGRGGMGDVYEAEHIEQGRRVALKVLNQRLSGRDDRARFLREGQLAASMNHPHTVYIFGSEEIDGIPTIAMELLSGGTLKDRVKEHGPLPPAVAVDAILQVIAGLDAMHAVGVLHRDVKPANCFVDIDGTVKVGDFGLSISTLARDVSQLTITGAFLGTPQFAAPEQLRGDPLDVRADIYAVGATLYYLLTGRPPFDDSHVLALVTRIATEAPRSPRALVPSLREGSPRSFCAALRGTGRNGLRATPYCRTRCSRSVRRRQLQRHSRCASRPV